MDFDSWSVFPSASALMLEELVVNLDVLFIFLEQISHSARI